MKTFARILAVSGFVIATAMNIGAVFADPVPAPVSAVVQIDENCTGFHIGDGRIVTAGHCVSKFGGFEVKLSDGTVVRASLVMFSDPRKADDIAVLHVYAENLSVLPVACGAPPSIGTEVHMTGYPGGFGLSTVWGRIAAPNRSYTALGAWRDAIPMNISSFGGFSGSPVMTEDGSVIGILVGSLAEQKNLAFAVPASRVCEFIGHEYLTS